MTQSLYHPPDSEKSFPLGIPYQVASSDLLLANAEVAGNVYAMCLLLGSQTFTEEFFIDGGSVYEALFANTLYAHALSTSPYYRLVLHHDSFTKYILSERPDGFGWFSWGGGDIKLSTVHWRSLLTVIMPSGMLTHFRYYSASVMSSLIKGCTIEEIILLLGPMAGLAIPLSDGSWLCIKNPMLEQYSAMEIAARYQYRPAPWWQISITQVEALESCLTTTLVHNIRFDIWQNQPHWLEPFDNFKELDEFIVAGLKQSKIWGFTGENEQTIFVQLCLSRNTYFIENIDCCGSILNANTLDNMSKLTKLASILGVHL